MEGDTATKIEKATWKVLWWIIGGAVTLGILAGIFWALFYSVQLANFSSIIPLRNWYQEVSWTIENQLVQTLPKPFDQTSTIEVFNSQTKDLYLYSLIGKFTSADLQNSIIRLIGFDGNTYAFNIDNLSDEDSNGNLVINVFELSRSNPKNPKFVSYSNINSSPFFSSDDYIKIEWLDKRSLMQIMNDLAKNPTVPLNSDSNHVSSFIVLKSR